MSNRFSKDGRAPATGNWNLNNFRITNLGSPVATTDAATKTYVDGKVPIVPLQSQCFLSLSGGNLVLSRFNGAYVNINGVAQLIPSAGVTLAATGTTPTTLYYIYVYMNSTTMTLEASTTVPATDSTTGVRIKNGDSTRTLVGMARPVTGPAWADSATQMFVVSYFNRQPKRLINVFTANRTRSNSTPGEINTEIRCEFLAWANSAVRATASGSFVSNTGSDISSAAISFDGGAQEDGGCQTASTSRTALNAISSKQLADGYHYVTLFGWSNSAAVVTYYGGGTAGDRTSLTLESLG
jgi:hypothetical protein